MNLEELKKPLLTIEKIAITEPELLNRLVFPEMVLAPIGTYNESYGEMEEEAPKDGKKQPPKRVDSALLLECLNNRALSFHVYHPNAEDIIEEYGAKFVEVQDHYHGFGLYSIIITTGLKRRRINGDRRFFEINPEIPIQKEEIYIYFDEDEQEFRRIAKKGFEDKLSETNEIKFSDEVSELILAYKHFFNQTFLSKKFGYNVGQKTDEVGKYFDFTEPFVQNIELMKQYYLYYHVIGVLNETEYTQIEKQIIRLDAFSIDLHRHINENHLDKLHLPVSEILLLDDTFMTKYKKLRNHYFRMKDERYWYNVFTGELHRNIMTFYKSYTLTEHYDDSQIEELRKKATIMNKITTYYLDIDSLDMLVEQKTISQNGWFYESLTESTKPDELNEKIAHAAKRIQSVLSDKSIFNQYPNHELFLNLL